MRKTQRSKSSPQRPTKRTSMRGVATSPSFTPSDNGPFCFGETALIELLDDPELLRPLLARRRHRPAGMQRLHDPNPRQHGVAAMLGDQHQRSDRREPSRLPASSRVRSSPPSGSGMGLRAYLWSLSYRRVLEGRSINFVSWMASRPQSTFPTWARFQTLIRPHVGKSTLRAVGTKSL